MAKKTEISDKLSLQTNTQNDIFSKRMLSSSNSSQNNRLKGFETEQSYVSLPTNQNMMSKHRMSPKTEQKIKAVRQRQKRVRFDN